MRRRPASMCVYDRQWGGLQSRGDMARVSAQGSLLALHDSTGFCLGFLDFPRRLKNRLTCPRVLAGFPAFPQSSVESPCSQYVFAIRTLPDAQARVVTGSQAWLMWGDIAAHLGSGGVSQGF